MGSCLGLNKLTLVLFSIFGYNLINFAPFCGSNFELLSSLQEKFSSKTFFARFVGNIEVLERLKKLSYLSILHCKQ